MALFNGIESTCFKYKRKETTHNIKRKKIYLFPPIFLILSLSSSLQTQISKSSAIIKTMGVKCNLRSSFSKITKPSTPKIIRPFLGGEEILPQKSNGSSPLFLKATCLTKFLIGTLFPVLQIPLTQYVGSLMIC